MDKPKAFIINPREIRSLSKKINITVSTEEALPFWLPGVGMIDADFVPPTHGEAARIWEEYLADLGLETINRAERDKGE